MGGGEMILCVNYIAIQWDNHQGGSGRPFENKLLVEVNQFQQLHEAYSAAVDALTKSLSDISMGQSEYKDFKILSIEIIKPASTQHDTTSRI